MSGFRQKVAIPRVDTSAPLRREPVIVRGALADMPAFSAWTDDYLRERVGDVIVPIEYSLRPIYRPNPKLNEGRYFRTEMAMQQCIDTITQPTTRFWHYLSALSIADHLPTLMVDLRTPEHLPASRLRGANLFFGPDGSGSQLHYDVTDNLMCVLRGAKRVLLVSPGHFRRLYPLSCWTAGNYASQVDVFANDAQARFPRFHDLVGHEAIVEAGEMLYIPQGWWHHVVNAGITLGVTFSYNAPAWRTVLWRNTRVHLHRVASWVRRHPE